MHSFNSLQEAILEEQESQKDDNIHLTRFLRVLANFLVLCCLAGSGYLIYFVVRRSQKFALDGLENHTWWERNEVAMRRSNMYLRDDIYTVYLGMLKGLSVNEHKCE